MISGRWFAGDYDEFGLDVQLQRMGSDPIVLGMEPRALRRGPGEQHVEVFGSNLPESLATQDVDLGPGVTVLRVLESDRNSATIRIRVDADAVVGPRDIFVAGASRSEGGFVYDEATSIRLNPEWGMARVGGARMPKGYVQFEARAFHEGLDGRVGTDDDVDLGIVDASWRLEEYSATFGDDDIAFVGELDRNTGLFTPAADGPNPERSGDRNNIGDVWVVADYMPPGASSGRPLRARSHLIVTVPLYMRWYPWEDIP
jgi:quinohemoprotein amine dehydrogenase